MKNVHFETIVIGLKLIETYKAEAAKEREKILGNTMYSQEWKEKQLQESYANAQEKIKDVNEKIQEAAANLKAFCEMNRPTLDITDNRISTVIMLAQTVGGRMPIDAQKRIIDPFMDNAEALETILPVLRDAGMHIAVGKAEKEVQRLTADSQFITNAADAAYYASTAVDSPMNPSHMSRIIGEAQGFARIYGLEMP